MKICGYFFFFWGGGGGVSFLYIIGRFKVKIQNGNIFWVANLPDIPDLFFLFFFWGGGGGGWVGGKQ